MQSAAVLYERGKRLLVQGRLPGARQALTAALTQATQAADPDLQARIRISLAYLEAESGDLGLGLDLCGEVLNQVGLRSETVGLAHSQCALLRLRAGDMVGALDAFDKAITRLRSPASLGNAFINRGGVYLDQGVTARARSDFDSAAGHYRAAEKEVEAAMAQHNLGYALYLQGDLVGGLREMDAAREVLAPLSPVSQAICDQDRAEVLIAAGLVSRGRAGLRDAARVLGQHRRSQRRAEAELTLARTLQYSDPRAALTAARQARGRFIRGGAEGLRVRAEGVALAAEVELGAKGPGLIGRGDALIAELQAQGLVWGAASARLHTARVLLRRGRLDEAARRIGMVRLSRSMPLSLRLLRRDVGAELLVARGRPMAALAQIRNGLVDLHAWQSTFGSLDLQTLVIGHGVGLARRGLELAVATGQPEVVYSWSERARMLASRVQPVRAPADDEVAADLAELRRLTVRDDAIRVPEPRRARELRDRVRERAWQVAGSGAVADPVAMADVQTALGESQALVAWVIAAGRVTALVVTHRDATLRDLGSQQALAGLLDGLLPDLDVAGAGLPAALGRGVRLQLAGRLVDLDAALVHPLQDLIGARSVVLTPGGALAGVPWTLFPSLVGRPVTLARSATRWLEQRGPLHLVSAGFVAGPRVARAQAEVDQAGRMWVGAEVLSGEKATAEAVAELAARVDVLHIAAHGRHSADNPLFSGLELHGGPWYGYDIDQLPRVPSVVLLSACEVGRSTVRAGEELIGMSSAWLHAGARWVIASPAAVNDEVAHDVLAAVHAGLLRGLDPPAALAAAVPAVTPDRAPAPFLCFSR